MQQLSVAHSLSCCLRIANLNSTNSMQLNYRLMLMKRSTFRLKLLPDLSKSPLLLWNHMKRRWDCFARVQSPTIGKSDQSMRPIRFALENNHNVLNRWRVASQLAGKGWTKFRWPAKSNRKKGRERKGREKIETLALVSTTWVNTFTRRMKGYWLRCLSGCES